MRETRLVSHLRRQAEVRAADAHFGEVGLLASLGHAQGVLEQKILRLQVSVDDVLTVHVRHRAHDLVEHRRQRALAAHFASNVVQANTNNHPFTRRSAEL